MSSVLPGRIMVSPSTNGASKPFDYYQNLPSPTYEIPNIPINNPMNRKIRVLTIGAGISGILMAYKIQKHCTNVEHIIYEKNKDIGGTWLENRYPGCACDIPSHAYAFSFALNPEWPRFFSNAPEIWQYLDRVCNTFNLRKFMVFNTRVVSCDWNNEGGIWRVQLCQSRPDGSFVRFEDTCDVLLHATGILNRYKWPNIEGLDTYQGKVIHTANWPQAYGPEQWANERVAVIGSGSSSIQTVPGMQPFVQHMSVFVRSAIWFVEIGGNYGQNHLYTAEEKERFKNDPNALVQHAKGIEDHVNDTFEAFFKDSQAQRENREKWETRMAKLIRDERLLKGFTPTWAVGCRRVTPGDPYIEAIQKSNVDVYFTGVARLTSNGVVGQDGIEREVDTVICATGFDVSFRPDFPIKGKNGIDLRSKWKDVPEGYFGLTIPDFPNFITFIGPTWPISNGSAIGPLGAVSDYAVQAIQKLQRVPNLKSFSPRQSLTDAFNAHVQQWINHTVWSESCRSWYRDEQTGRVNAIWPGSSLHYIEAIKEVRWEDYEMEYRRTTEHGKELNPFSWLGMGFSLGPDKSPYLKMEAIDPQWWEYISQTPSA